MTLKQQLAYYTISTITNF